MLYLMRAMLNALKRKEKKKVILHLCIHSFMELSFHSIDCRCYYYYYYYYYFFFFFFLLIFYGYLLLWSFFFFF